MKIKWLKRKFLFILHTQKAIKTYKHDLEENKIILYNQVSVSVKYKYASFRGLYTQ